MFLPYAPPAAPVILWRHYVLTIAAAATMARFTAAAA